jgi:hypothetical protein
MHKEFKLVFQFTILLFFSSKGTMNFGEFMHLHLFTSGIDLEKKGVLNMMKLFPTFTKLVSKNYRWNKWVQVCISFTTLMCFKHSK